MKNKWTQSCLSIALGFLAVVNAEACTNVQVKAQDQTLIVGRTMEFALDLQSRLMNSPRDKKFQTTMRDGTPTKGWTSKYGYLFADYFKTGQTVDGMNEKGLSFGYLYLPGYTTYPSLPSANKENALPYTVFGDYILGNFSTVDEVEQGLKTLHIFAQPIPINAHQEAILPVHAIITDKSGKSIVVEFIKGKLVVYKNPLGILTNAPTFDWQLNNLNNYVNLSPNAPNPVVIDGLTYAGTGQGSGLVGLPGDPTPPSRFVKMALFQKTAMPVADAKGALLLTEHILNSVDIPYGIIRGAQGTPNTPDNLDKTEWVVYKDLTHNVMYFRTYDNPTLQSIDMNKIDFSAGSKQFALPMASEAIIPDVTSKLMQSPATISGQ